MADKEIINLEVEEVSLINLNFNETRIPVVHIILSEDSPFFEVNAVNSNEYLISDISADSERNTLTIFFSINPESLDEGDELDTTVFALGLPLQYVQASHMIGMWLPAPSFLISTGFGELEPEEVNNVDINFFDAIIDFPELGTAEFLTLMSTLTKATTGKIAINIDVQSFNEVRSELIAIIMELLNGNQDALIRLYGYINPLNTLRDEQKNDNFVQSAEQEKLFIFRDLVQTLQRETHPAVLAPILKAAADPETFFSDIEEFESMMAKNGLNESFFGDEQANTLNVNPNSTAEAKIAFMSTALDKNLLPGKLASLKDKINLDLVFSQNWNQVNLGEVEEHNGEYIVSMVIVVASRLARLQQIDSESNKAFSPVIVLVKGLSIPNEQIFWAMIESIKLLATQRSIPFNELMEFTVPDINEPRTALQAPLGMLLHQFGHLIIREEWRKEIISLALKELPVIQSFIEDLFPEEFSDPKDTTDYDPADEHKNNHPCIPAQAAMNLLSIGFGVLDIIDQLGKAMVSLAELNAFKHTDFSKGSIGWNDYTKDYLSKIIEVES